MDHENIPVAADAENQSAVRLAIESTPPGNPGSISREYAKQIRVDLLRRSKNPLAIGLTAKELRSFEQDENTRGYRVIVAAAAAKLANVLPKGIADKDRELQRRIVTAGIDAGIDWQFRAYGDADDQWSKPCPAKGPRPLWLPMIEYRICPKSVERRIAETWTDYVTRGIDEEEPYCRPTETSDWLWKVLLWCFMLLAAAVVGGAYAWQFFLR